MGIPKSYIDYMHRKDILVLGYCLACGLPKNNKCQCQNWLEVIAGMKADKEKRVINGRTL